MSPNTKNRLGLSQFFLWHDKGSLALTELIQALSTVCMLTVVCGPDTIKMTTTELRYRHYILGLTPISIFFYKKTFIVSFSSGSPKLDNMTKNDQKFTF